MVCEYVADIKVLLKLDADEALAGCEKQVIIVCGYVHVIYVIRVYISLFDFFSCTFILYFF